MTFHVGTRAYVVLIVQGPIKDDRGHEVVGITDWTSREIHISAKVAPRSRLEVLGHELRHAWLWAVPQPRSEEEDCAFSSLVQEAMFDELTAQGGRKALEALRVRRQVPVKRRPPTRH